MKRQTGRSSRRLVEANSQVERFREAARNLGADESEEAFDRALRKVASAPPAPMLKRGKRRSAKRDDPKRRRDQSK